LERNRIFKIKPAFLEALLRQVLEADFENLPQDMMSEWPHSGSMGRPFSCLPIDEGYRDNRDHAMPVFRQLGLQFTLFVPSGFSEGDPDVRWLVLGEVVRRT